MARFFSLSDVDPDALSNGVSVVGYGNQGRAQALNLRDSGVPVVVGQRAGKGFDQAVADGFQPVTISEALSASPTVMLTLPDLTMSEIWAATIMPHLQAGQTVLFCHGFNVVYDLVAFPEGIDVALVAPKGAGAKLRAEFESGRGLAALVAVERDATGQAWSRTLAYAAALGSFRSLVMETTFREETHTDLFGEQAVLCGGIPELLKMAFETLVAAGYSPEAAYFECIHEAKLITDLVYDRGLAGMRSAISDTAEWGGFAVGPSVIGSSTKRAMDEALINIQNGEFTKRWVAESADGRPQLQQMEEDEAAHPSAPVGEELRRRMGIRP